MSARDHVEERPRDARPDQAGDRVQGRAVVLDRTGQRLDAEREQQREHEDHRRVPEREEEADAERPLALLHELARGVVDGRDVVGVEGVAHAQRVGREPDAGGEGAAGAEAEVVRDDDPEEQAEADDVQADDRGGQATSPRPLGRASARRGCGSACVGLRRAGRAQAGDREVREARPVADGVEHRLAHAVERSRRQRRGLPAALAQDELARAARRAGRARARGRGGRGGRGRGPRGPRGCDRPTRRRRRPRDPRRSAVGRSRTARAAAGAARSRGAGRSRGRRRRRQGLSTPAPQARGDGTVTRDPPGRSPHPHGAFWVLLRTTRRSGSPRVLTRRAWRPELDALARRRPAVLDAPEAPHGERQRPRGDEQAEDDVARAR